MIQQLQAEEKFSYHQIYRKDSLFKHWLSILSQNREYIQTDPVSVWHSSQRVIERLRGEHEDRDEMIEFLVDDMLGKFDRNMVVATMCVTFTRLANATEEGKEDEAHPNDPICVAIFRYFEKESLFISLLQEMRSKQFGNDGNKVVLTPSDPLMQTPTTEDLPQAIQAEMQDMHQMVMQWTEPLSMCMKAEIFSRWNSLWQSICFDPELFAELKKVNPKSNKNKWNTNLKMVCNVLGLFKAELGLDITIQKLNNTLFKNNHSSYISNYAVKDGSDAALSKEQLSRVKSILAEKA